MKLLLLVAALTPVLAVALIRVPLKKIEQVGAAGVADDDDDDPRTMGLNIPPLRRTAHMQARDEDGNPKKTAINIDDFQNAQVGWNVSRPFACLLAGLARSALTVTHPRTRTRSSTAKLALARLRKQ